MRARLSINPLYCKQKSNQTSIRYLSLKEASRSMSKTQFEKLALANMFCSMKCQR